MTLATSNNSQPWCCNCFYAYMEDVNGFVFTSDNHTRHVQEFLVNPIVSASIVLETKVVGMIRGIQMSGTVSQPEGDLLKKCRSRYLRRFPYAVLMETTLWLFEPSYIKMTDNRLGFGKKLMWEKDAEG